MKKQPFVLLELDVYAYFSERRHQFTLDTC